jgi:hypothetical protein
MPLNANATPAAQTRQKMRHFPRTKQITPCVLDNIP